VTDGGAPSTATPSSGSLAISEIHADAAGDERDNLNDEYLVFENMGAQAIDIGGWTVSDESGHEYTVPDGVTVESGDQVTLHTGGGSNTATDLYWGSESPIWNNGGDTVTVRDSSSAIVIEEEYS
jgi:competence protein ComEC